MAKARRKGKSPDQLLIDWNAWRRRIEVDLKTLHYHKSQFDETFNEVARKMQHAQETLGKLAAEIEDQNVS